MACASSCSEPGSHESYGECLRAKRLQLDDHSLRNDLRLERRKDQTLERYRQLRISGYQPPSIKKSRLDQFEKALDA